MRIADMLARSKPTVSFEFMAPRDESEVDALERTVATLAGHAPDWVAINAPIADANSKDFSVEDPASNW